MSLSGRVLRSVIAPSLATLWTLAAAGCAAEPAADEATEADVAPIIQAKVHVLDGEPGVDLDVQADSISASRTQFAELETYAPGDVLVSGHAAGLLRRVRGSHVDGDRVVIDTEPASLEDVFEQVHLRGTVGEDQPGPATSGLAPRSIHLALPKLDVANKRIPLGGGSEIEIVDGSFAFDPQLDFDLTMHRGRLEHLKVVASGESEGNLHLRYDLHKSAEAQAGFFFHLKEEGMPLVEAPPYYAVFWAGYVPVVVAVRARLLAGYELNVGGDVFGEESVSATGSVAAGLEYASGGWRNVASRSLSVRAAAAPTLTSHEVSGDVTLTARLDVSFYELAGPYIGLQAYTGVGHEGNADTSGWFTEVGLRGLAGAQVAVFGKSVAGYQSVLFDVNDQRSF